MYISIMLFTTYHDTPKAYMYRHFLLTIHDNLKKNIFIEAVDKRKKIGGLNG